MMAGEVMTVNQAARFLGFSPYTIRGMARRGEIPARKVGREWRFLRSALIDWLQSRTAAGVAERGVEAEPRLRIRPASTGSGRRDVSIEHDRYLADR